MANIKTINLQPRGEKGDMKSSSKTITLTQGYKDPRSRKGLYYGSDGLIKTKDGKWIEDPKTVHPTKT